MLMVIGQSEPIGIGFNEIQRTICCSSRTVNRYRKQLLGLNFIEYDSRGKLHITQKGKDLCHNESLQNHLATRSNRRQESFTKIHSKKNNIGNRNVTDKQTHQECAHILLSVVAALGNHNFEPTDCPAPGDSASFDIRTGQLTFMTPTNHIPGVGLSDFTKNEIEGIQATLDRRRFVIYNEVFAYLDLPREELEQYIYELSSGDGNPILKEIIISDYEFLSYSFDIDGDDPNFITIVRDGARVNEDQLTHREVINEMGKYVKHKISFYHDICCSRDDFNGLEIGSKIVFNINNESSRRFLGLNDYYKKNNFSISTWKEKRYMIADESLRDFILICYRALDLVWQRMDYVHHHFKSRPKYKWTKTIRKRYIDWYKLVYGNIDV